MDMNYRGGMWEGGGGQDGVEWGGKWDNCNSIINKYILKNKKQNKTKNNKQINQVLLRTPNCSLSTSYQMSTLGLKISFLH